MAGKRNRLLKRDLYLNQLIAFQDTDSVKIITGIHRCVKSSVMKLMMEHLHEEGISEDQIVSMNFESMEFRGMDAGMLYQYVKAQMRPEKRMYLF